MSTSISWPFIGNAHLGRMLIDASAAETLPAVMVWRGPAGVGKATAAQWLVQMSLCQQPQRPCQTCTNCKQILSNTHPAVVWLSGTSAEPISIEQARHALQQFQWATLAGEQRWLVMTDAEHLTENATNAILKFLEEPPPSLHILLTTSQPDRILPTLLSRAAVYYWHTVTMDDLSALRPTGMSSTTWRQMVARAAGRPGLLTSFLVDADRLATETENRDVLLEVLRTETPAKLSRQMTPATANDLAATWELTVRELLLTKTEARAGRLWPQHSAFTTLASQLSLGQITGLAERYLRRYTLLQHHVQPRFILEDLQLV